MSVTVRSEMPRTSSMESCTSGVESLEIDSPLWKLRGQDVVIKYGDAAMDRPHRQSDSASLIQVAIRGRRASHEANG